MKDKADNVLYVGKAKDLRRRLNNYRIANPDRMPRRHLRLVREAKRIELQFCANESSALTREARLLRALKPKFNRAGVWPGKTRFVAWRVRGEQLEIMVVETPEPGWLRVGPLNGHAVILQRTLARLLWLALNEDRAVAELPPGWAQGRYMELVSIHCGGSADDVTAMLDAFFWDNADQFISWLGSKFAARTIPFERGVIQKELEILEEFRLKQTLKDNNRRQLALL